MTDQVPSKEQAPTAKELIDSLARFADHNEFCPIASWEPQDEEDFDMPDCSCGLNLLIAHANAYSADEPLQRLQRPFTPDEAKAYRAFIEEYFEPASSQPPGDSALVNAVWELADDSEEDAETHDVTISAASWQLLLKALWDCGDRHQRRLRNLGWQPPTPTKEVKS